VVVGSCAEAKEVKGRDRKSDRSWLETSSVMAPPQSCYSYSMLLAARWHAVDGCEIQKVEGRKEEMRFEAKVSKVQ
jgi:hypothetical protein